MNLKASKGGYKKGKNLNPNDYIHCYVIGYLGYSLLHSVWTKKSVVSDFWGGGGGYFETAFSLSILAILDRYCTGTVPLHLSTICIAHSVYHSVPIRDPAFCEDRFGTNCSSTVWTTHFVMWTGGSVPFRNAYARKGFRTDPNCTGSVCTAMAPFVPDVERVYISTIMKSSIVKILI